VSPGVVTLLVELGRELLGIVAEAWAESKDATARKRLELEHVRRANKRRALRVKRESWATHR
jgi:hypothetical protein